MTSEEKRMTLENTEQVLFRHLQDLNDEVEQNDGHVRDHMVIDGYKDVVKTLKNLKVLGAVGVSGSPDPKPAPAAVAPVAA